MMKHFIWIFVLVLATPLAWAQEEENFKLNVDVDLVEVHVNVTDEYDHPIGNLTKSNFRLTEDRIQQEITVFKHEDIPVSLGLVIDNSRSIEPRKQRLDAAALSFVRKGNPEDESFIIHFDNDCLLYTSDAADERSSVD